MTDVVGEAIRVGAKGCFQDWRVCLTLQHFEVVDADRIIIALQQPFMLNKPEEKFLQGRNTEMIRDVFDGIDKLKSPD